MVKLFVSWREFIPHKRACKAQLSFLSPLPRSENLVEDFLHLTELSLLTDLFILDSKQIDFRSLVLNLFLLHTILDELPLLLEQHRFVMLFDSGFVEDT